MAFDLLLFSKKEEVFNCDGVIEYLETHPLLTSRTVDGVNYAYIYRNELTGVYFVIHYNTTTQLEESFHQNEQFSFTAFYFVMHYFKPTYFAIESIPFLVDLIKKFNLYIYNPQLNLEDAKFEQYEVEDLIESYVKNNEESAREYHKQIPLKSLSKETSLYSYQYLLKMNDFEQQLGEPYLVPQIHFINHIPTNKIYSVITWADGIPVLIPKCDFILILKPKKKFLLKKHQASLIPYTELVNHFKDLASIFEHDCVYLSSENHEAIYTRFMELPEYAYDEYEPVNHDDFVDCEL